MEKKRALGACSREVAFYLCTGQYITTLHQLAMAISAASPQCFAYHVNSQKNDFARWARDVFGEEELARRLEQSRERDRTVDIILNRLRELQN